ncbi:MAG: substrate-binding domain-containing protein [Myxococcota bacterium]
MNEPRRALAASILVVLLSASASIGLAYVAERSAPPPRPTSRGQGLRAGPEPMQIAGSGANIRLTRHLLEELPGVRVHDSVGSGGGLHALQDGVIDIALLSRPLRPREAEGIESTAYARTPLVWALQGPPRDVTEDELAGWYAGEGDVLPLLRELGDSAISEVRAASPAIANAHDEAARAGRAEILLTDEAMLRAVAQIDAAFGLTDLGQIRLAELPLSPLSVDGVEPTIENARGGRYPYVRTLYAATREGDTRAQALVQLLTAEVARRDLEALGYWGLP